MENNNSNTNQSKQQDQKKKDKPKKKLQLNSQVFKQPNEKRFEQQRCEKINSQGYVEEFYLPNEMSMKRIYICDQQEGWIDENGFYYNSNGKNILDYDTNNYQRPRLVNEYPVYKQYKNSYNDDYGEDEDQEEDIMDDSSEIDHQIQEMEEIIEEYPNNEDMKIIIEGLDRYCNEKELTEFLDIKQNDYSKIHFNGLKEDEKHDGTGYIITKFKDIALQISDKHQRTMTVEGYSNLIRINVLSHDDFIADELQHLEEGEQNQGNVKYVLKSQPGEQKSQPQEEEKKVEQKQKKPEGPYDCYYYNSLSQEDQKEITIKLDQRPQKVQLYLQVSNQSEVDIEKIIKEKDLFTEAYSIKKMMDNYEINILKYGFKVFQNIYAILHKVQQENDIKIYIKQKSQPSAKQQQQTSNSKKK